MPGSVALLGIALSALFSYTEGGGNLRLETRAGQAPFNASTKPETFFLAMVTPQAVLQVAEPGRDTRANLYSRFLLREPNPSNEFNVLILHGIGLTHRQKPSLRSEIRLDVFASYGEEDYTTFRDQLGKPSGALGQTTARTTIPASLDMVNTSISLEALRLQTRLSGFSLRLGWEYRNTLTQSPTQPSTNETEYKLPEQMTSTFTPSYFEQVTRRSRLVLSVTTTHHHVTKQYDGFVVQPRVDWNHDLSKNQRVLIAGGLTLAKTLKIKNDPTLDPLEKPDRNRLDPIGPMATFTLDSNLVHRRDFRLKSQVQTGLNWYFDPILVTGYSNLFFTSSIDATFGPRFTMGTRLSYSTPMERPPQKDVQDVSVLAASLPMVYRWSDEWVMETGAQFAIRGPYHAGLSEFKGMELWAYVAFTGGLQQRKPKP